MKKLTAFILLLCLTVFAGCQKEETVLPEDSAAIERMSALTADDLQYVTADFDNISAEELAAAMNGAVEHRIDRDEDVNSFYYLEAYLSEDYSSDGESFWLRAGLEEDLVQMIYRDGAGNNEKLFFSDSDLYWLIRNNYLTDQTVDAAAYEPYRDIIAGRAQTYVDETKNILGEPAFTGFEVTEFVPVDSFTAEDGEYTVYSWDVAFLTDDPMNVGWAGGMSLDAEARVRSLDESRYFVVKTPAAGEEEYHFLYWDLYFGEDEASGRDNAWQEIQQAFAK